MPKSGLSGAPLKWPAIPSGTRSGFSYAPASASARSAISAGTIWTATTGELSRNKTSKRIDVYLAARARAILDDCPDFGDDTPFFSASGGKIGLRPDGFHLALKRHIRPRLDDAADELGLPRIREHWTPHDLRRSVRSGLTGWAGVFPDIAERVLNHSITGIRSVYDHADYRAHVAEALKAWDAELARILAGEHATVTPIKREAV